VEQVTCKSCKYCQSPNVIKFGKYNNVQYYWCKDCKRKFSGVVEQPFEVTARIPIRLASPSGRKARRKTTKHRVTKPKVSTPSVSVMGWQGASSP